MISLPKKYYKIDNIDLILTAGPYGLYFKYNDENVKIPIKIIKKILDPEESQTITPADLTAVIQAHKNKKLAKADKKEAKTSAKVASTSGKKVAKKPPTQKSIKSAKTS
jgi:topoisomerase IA-like protein